MKRYLFIVLLSLGSCKKEAIPDPEPALLIGPENNNRCNTAVRISDQKSQVNFSWQTAPNADKYELVIRDIVTNVDQKKETIRLFSSIVLDRGKQYAWWVNSKSEQTETITKSEVWTFYLEGIQTSSHFPFPAKLISPQNNTQVSLENGALTLKWEVVDLDGDIESYDVYMGASPDDLILAAENLTSNSISASLDADQSYYWKVLTRDQEGNVSNSPVGYFRTSL
jgi:hypothetical protein